MSRPTARSHQLKNTKKTKAWVDYYSLVSWPITTNYKFVIIICILLHARARDRHSTVCMDGHVDLVCARVSFRVTFDLCAIEALPVESP